MNRINLILNNKIFLDNYKIIEKFEINREFCKHDLSHSLDVARIMYIKNLEQNLGVNKEIIYAVALLHDIGRSLEYTKKMDHSIGGQELSRIILENCEYEQTEIEEIINAVISHNNEDNICLNKLLREADKFSRNCFLCKKKKECNWTEEKKNKGIQL